MIQQQLEPWMDHTLSLQAKTRTKYALLIAPNRTSNTLPVNIPMSVSAPTTLITMPLFNRSQIATWPALAMRASFVAQAIVFLCINWCLRPRRDNFSVQSFRFVKLDSVVYPMDGSRLFVIESDIYRCLNPFQGLVAFAHARLRCRNCWRGGIQLETWNQPNDFPTNISDMAMYSTTLWSLILKCMHFRQYARTKLNKRRSHG